ncbi:unnamed protein product, partial [Discosporangium mesarthrocarpum]
MAAAGILRSTEKWAEAAAAAAGRGGVGVETLSVRPSWLEKLSRWSKALELYDESMADCDKALASPPAALLELEEERRRRGMRGRGRTHISSL